MADLVTFEDLKSLLHLDNDEEDYPALTLLRDSVKDAIESFLGRTIDNDSYSETKRIVSKTKMVPLNALPVDSVSSVTIDGSASTDYTISDYGVELGATVSNLPVVVSYIGGLEEIPGPINRAALIQTAYEYQNHDHIGAESVSTDGGSVQRPSLGLLKEVQRLLKTFKHPLNRMF